MAPGRAPRRIQRDESRVWEESVDVLAIRGRGGSGAIVADVDFVRMVADNFVAPDRLAGLPVERQHEKFALFDSREINLILHHDWRGAPHRSFDPPIQIRLRSEFAWQPRRV